MRMRASHDLPDDFHAILTSMHDKIDENDGIATNNDARVTALVRVSYAEPQLEFNVEMERETKRCR